MKKILFDERGLKEGDPYKKDQWEAISSHNTKEIKGFFGKYRFLSNFWPAKIFLDGDEYQTVENAYQASKYEKENRTYLKNSTPKEAIIFSRNNPLKNFDLKKWNGKKLKVMKKLLEQKFDKNLNKDNHKRLLLTKNKYLEEANYWEDVYWGVHKTSKKENGKGENNLGKLLMAIRENMQSHL